MIGVKTDTSGKWKKIDVFCPSCGGRHVWENTDGTHYTPSGGDGCICISCGGLYHGLNEPYDNEQTAKIAMEVFEAYERIRLRRNVM